MKNSVDFSSSTLKFSVSGLRGLYPNDLHPDNIVDMVYAFARTLATQSDSKEVALARDTRPSGVAVYHLACGILTACGYNVHQLEIVPTPTIKAYIKTKNLAGGIMVSASHNPMQYNAFKFMKSKGFFFEQKDNETWQSFLNSEHQWNSYQDQGKVIANTDAENLHIDQVIESVFPSGIPDLSFLKVAIDPVAACASNIIPALLKKLNVRYVATNGTFADEFPRKAEPTPDALNDLCALVKKEKCDVGFAFDPDADRLALVDEQGIPRGEEYTLPLILSEALPVLQKKRKAEKKINCVVNLSTSWLNRYVCEQNNCSLFLSPVGEANVVAEMLQQDAMFGGEGNGGVIDPNVSSMGRDSLSGVAWMLRLLATEKQGLSRLAQKFPQVFMKKHAIQMDADTLETIAQKMQNHFDDMKTDMRDGYHFSAKKGIPWIHLRASNTEPIVRLSTECESEEQEENIMRALKSFGLEIKK